MEDAEFERIVSDPAARTANYAAMVQAYYARVTDTYRDAWGDSFHFAVFSGSETLREAMAATERRLADEGRFRPGMKVLDIGCGVGGPALTIATHSGAHITGINIVKRHIQIARRMATKRGLSDRTRFEVADALHLPFADESFDAAYVFEAGCHMPDKARFYQEASRVLRPGGVFLGYDWMQRENLSPKEQTRYIEPICRCHSVPHLVSLSELQGYLTDAGLKVEALGDAATRGNILRNWEILDEHTIRNIRTIPSWLMPRVLRMLTDGGIALAEGARAGTFLIGYWRAYKPGTPRGM